LSLILSENISHEDVIKEIKKSGGEYLQEVMLFDVYQNESLFSNRQKSLSFRLIFQSSQKTLEKNEVKNSMTKIEEKLTEIFTVKIR
jgi:phenylalanyl-tRNA synthetase beta chain